MTLNNKQDLDALLRRWPALASGKEEGVVEHEDKVDWEARADAIVRAAATAGPGDANVLAALEAPPLPVLPGEPEKLAASAGERKMVQETESGGSLTSSGSSSTASASAAPRERKRTSLKAIAERASQSGVRPSAPSATSSSGTRTPVPGHPIEAEDHDSGVIDLHAVHASTTAQRGAGAERERPGIASRSDEAKPAAALAPAEAKPPAVIPIATAKAPKKNNSGALAGFAIAVLGVAAAFALVQIQKPKEAAVTPEAQSPVTAEAKPPPVEAPIATALAAAQAPAPPANAEPEIKGHGPKVAGPTPGGGLAPAAPLGARAAAAPPQEKVALAPKSAPDTKPGDLGSEMARAVGAEGQAKESAAGSPEPAAGNLKNQSIPEQPAQGSVSSAIGAVMSGAKACVSDAEDVSRANVTFASNGKVSNITVTGWAASNGKADCVKAALKGATVGPFSRSTFTVPVTIRP
jgi:hypothetical protein